RADGSVACWGRAAGGRLGSTPCCTNQTTPLAVEGLSNIISVSAGAGFACAVASNGEVQCWGQSVLGNGTTGTVAYTPVYAFGLSDAVRLSAGSSHACALRNTGEVACWGSNGSGQLGNGTPSSLVTIPVAVSGLDDAVDIGADGYHTCAVRA